MLMSGLFYKNKMISVIILLSLYVSLGLYSGAILLFLIKPVLCMLECDYAQDRKRRDEMNRACMIVWLVIYLIVISVLIVDKKKEILSNS